MERARLADGREVRIRVAVPDDPYIARRDLETVTAELYDSEDRLLGTVTTPFDSEDTSEARRLAREIASALARGEMEPTAETIQTVLDRRPE